MGQKWAKTFEQISKRKIYKCPTTHKMLNNINHQVIKIKKHNEIPLRTYQDSYYKTQQKMTNIGEDMENWNFVHCQWECKTVQLV